MARRGEWCVSCLLVCDGEDERGFCLNENLPPIPWIRLMSKPYSSGEIDPFTEETAYVPPLGRGKEPVNGKPKRPRFEDDDLEEDPRPGVPAASEPLPRGARKLPRFDLEGSGDPPEPAGGTPGPRPKGGGPWAGGKEPSRSEPRELPREDESDFLLPARAHARPEDSERWRYLRAFTRATYMLEGPGTGEFGSPDEPGHLAGSVRRAGTGLLGSLVLEFEKYQRRSAEKDLSPELLEALEACGRRAGELRGLLAQWAGVGEDAVTDLLAEISEKQEEFTALMGAA